MGGGRLNGVHKITARHSSTPRAAVPSLSTLVTNGHASTGFTATACFCMYHTHMTALQGLPPGDEYIPRSDPLLSTRIGHTRRLCLSASFPETFEGTQGAFPVRAHSPLFAKPRPRESGDSTCWDESWWSKSVSGGGHVPAAMAPLQHLTLSPLPLH